MPKYRFVLIWLLFLLWLLAQMPVVLRLAQQGQMPIDFLAYYRAAEALQAGKSPYLAPEDSRAIWQEFHRREVEVITAQETAGRGQEVLQEQARRAQLPGPYLYLPTLARLILFFHLSPLPFSMILLLSTLGFGWLWLRSTHTHAIWLLLVIGSWDVLASLAGGNVELLLLFATLLAAWCLWHDHALRAAPLLAFVVLIKPFYGLFFAAFGLIGWVSHTSARRRILKTWMIAGVLATSMIALEIHGWGSVLRDQTFYYLQHAWEYQWFGLPVVEQTPMSNWNRTPLQTLVTARAPARTAQLLALALWLHLLGVTVWYVRARRIDFPLAFALALVLLYWGRPVGWTFVYLELVVGAAVWSRLTSTQRGVWLAGAVALLLSHWVALVRTTLGFGMPFLTLQIAHVPWETWLVLPLSWLLLLYGASRSARDASC